MDDPDPPRPLDRETLRQLLDREQVDQRSYRFDGSHGDEAYVLAIRPGGWAVFFAECGVEVDRREFDTEDEACHDLLLRLVSDPTTRCP